MDVPSSLASRLLAGLLPPDMAASACRHLLHPQSPVQACKRAVVARACRGVAVAAPYVHSLAARVLALIADNEGVAGGLALLALLAAVVLVLRAVSRLLLWWTRLSLRLAFWGLVAALAAAVWSRGLAESLRDAVVVAANVVGYLTVLKNVWLDEYNRYEGQQAMGYGAAGRGSASDRR